MCMSADLDDAEFFRERPGRYHRLRKPFPGEFISKVPTIHWSLVSRVGDSYFRFPLPVEHIGGARTGCPDEERLLSHLWTMFFINRRSSPFFRDIVKLTDAMCLAPRAS